MTHYHESGPEFSHGPGRGIRWGLYVIASLLPTFSGAFEAAQESHHHGVDTSSSFGVHCQNSSISGYSPCAIENYFGKVTHLHWVTSKGALSKDVKVSNGEQRAHLLLMVVSGNRLCTLDRVWLQRIQLDWPSIGLVQLSLTQELLPVHGCPIIDMPKGYKATTHVDLLVTPKFCKAQAARFIRN